MKSENESEQKTKCRNRQMPKMGRFDHDDAEKQNKNLVRGKKNRNHRKSESGAIGMEVAGSAGATVTRRRQKQKRPGKKKGGVLRNAKDLRVRRRDRDDRR